MALALLPGMDAHTELTPACPPETSNPVLGHLLSGYRFRVCEDVASAIQALEVRRRVYIEGVGYSLPVPDAYDGRSWLLLAEDAESGKVVGSMRLTPRFGGPLEAEEYFTLPRELATPRTVEISRFAILPEHRTGRTFLPIVSVGLFKLAIEFLKGRGLRQVVICSKPERLWMYEWLRFKRSGLTARYAKLNNAEHELMSFDFTRLHQNFEGHPFEEVLLGIDYPEIVVPDHLPPLGLGFEKADTFRLARVA
jgi:N-acyl-L-homoserine lactone synthetase